MDVKTVTFDLNAGPITYTVGVGNVSQIKILPDGTVGIAYNNNTQPINYKGCGFSFSN